MTRKEGETPLISKNMQALYGMLEKMPTPALEQVIGIRKKRKGVAQPFEGQIEMEGFSVKEDLVKLPESRKKEKNFPNIGDIPDVRPSYFNKYHQAFISKENLGVIKQRLKTDMDDKSLVKRLIVFGGGTEIFFNKSDRDNFRLCGGMVAVKYDGHFDNSDFPANTDCYVVLGNLTDKEKPMKRESVNYVINKSLSYVEKKLFLNDQESHPVGLPTGEQFFAYPQKAIQLRCSIKNKSEILK